MTLAAVEMRNDELSEYLPSISRKVNEAGCMRSLTKVNVRKNQVSFQGFLVLIYILSIHIFESLEEYESFRETLSGLKSWTVEKM